jgi:hypothetical protein
MHSQSFTGSSAVSIDVSDATKNGVPSNPDQIVVKCWGMPSPVRRGRVQLVSLPGFESVDLALKSPDRGLQVFGLLLLCVNCLN